MGGNNIMVSLVCADATMMKSWDDDRMKRWHGTLTHFPAAPLPAACTYTLDHMVWCTVFEITSLSLQAARVCLRVSIQCTHLYSTIMGLFFFPSRILFLLFCNTQHIVGLCELVGGSRAEHKDDLRRFTYGSRAFIT